MRSKELQPRLLYPAKPPCRIEEQIKIFPDKEKLKTFKHQTSTATNVKGLALRRRGKRGGKKNQRKTV